MILSDFFYNFHLVFSKVAFAFFKHDFILFSFYIFKIEDGFYTSVHVYTRRTHSYWTWQFSKQLLLQNIVVTANIVATDQLLVGGNKNGKPAI